MYNWTFSPLKDPLGSPIAELRVSHPFPPDQLLIADYSPPPPPKCPWSAPALKVWRYGHMFYHYLKLSSSLLAIKTMSTPKSAQLDYHPLIEPHLLLWGESTKEILLRVMMILQTRGARLLCNPLSRQSCSLLHLCMRVVHHACRLQSFIRQWEIHDYNTRSLHSFNLPCQHYSLTLRKPFYTGAKLHNLSPSQNQKKAIQIGDVAIDAWWATNLQSRRAPGLTIILRKRHTNWPYPWQWYSVCVFA